MGCGMRSIRRRESSKETNEVSTTCGSRWVSRGYRRTMKETTTNGNLLEVKDLRTYFNTEDGVVKAVDGVSFELKHGETLGIVGESGSGKTVANLSIMRLIAEPPGRIAGGSIEFNGRDILKLSRTELRALRGW